MTDKQRKKLDKLRLAMEFSRRQFEEPRKNRRKAIQQFVGFHYAGGGSPDKVPINGIAFMVQTLSHYLVARNPAVLISSQFPTLQAGAENIEIRTNDSIKEIHLADALRRWATDAFFGLSILKVAISPLEDIEIGGRLNKPGQVFADVVDLDDWVHDASVNRFDQVSFMGNRYKMRLDDVRNSRFFDKSRRLVLPTSRELAEDGLPRVDEISRGIYEMDGDEWEQHVDLWEIYFPHENVVRIFPDKQNDVLLREEKWDGPEGGPFHKLSYTDVPGQVMPLPPVANLMDLHQTVNLLWNKSVRDAQKQKTVIPYGGDNWQDVERILKATNGSGVFQNTSGQDIPRELKYGGADPATVAMAMQSYQLFKERAGNLDLLAGLGPQSDTVGQDKLLNENANRQVADMQGRFGDATKKVVRAIAWYEYTDPVRQSTLRKSIPGTGSYIPVTWSPETREADFFNFDIDIEPYSMQDRSPQERLQRLLQLVQTFVIPMLPEIQRTGGMFDVEAFFETVAKLGDFRELSSFLLFVGETAGQPTSDVNPAIPEPRQAASTTRTNVRINRPGATNQGQQAEMVKLLLGSAGQDAQVSSLARATG